MPYDPLLHRRRSIRLRGYDYAQAGAYFVTICTQDRACLFGTIDDDEEEMRLNEAGHAVVNCWHRLSTKFAHIEMDTVVVMPNHIHGIILIDHQIPPYDMGDHMGSPLPVLGDVVGWFKTMTTNEYIRGVKERGWTPFSGRLWQRNFFEHIIRNESAHDRARVYIEANPSRWTQDDENEQQADTNR
jgi:putative transposase